MHFEYKNKLTGADIEQIEAFYNGLDMAPIEQHPIWCAEIDLKQVVYFIAYEDSQIVCYSVLYEKTAGPVRFANIRFGPLSNNLEYIVDALIEIKRHYKKRAFSYLSVQLAMLTGTDTDLIEAKLYQEVKFKNRFNRDNWSSIIVNLNGDLETIFNNFRTGHKRSIKKAIKANTSVKLAESPNEIKELAQVYHKMESYRKINTHSLVFTEKLFTRIYEFLKHKNKGFVLIVKDDSGKIIGGTINIFQGKGVRYYKGASDPDKKDIPVLHAAFYESMKIAKNMGYQYLDLWGYNHYVYKDDQVYNINLFKQGFGGEFIFYPKIIHIQLFPFGRLLHNTIKTLKQKIYSSRK